MQSSGSRSAFTLIELLTVIAIIGILAAIIIPTVGRVRASAVRGKVRAQFAQWGTAIEQFRSEYGYYPNFSTTATGTIPDLARVNEVPRLFFQTLVGRDETGGTTLIPRAVAANSKRIGFTAFGPEEVTAAPNFVILDAFGNADIVVIVDRDLNGIIPRATITGASMQTGNPAAAPSFSPPADKVPEDVRAGVIFMSVGEGRNAADIVYSWQ